jgi:hypothetical protein
MLSQTSKDLTAAEPQRKYCARHTAEAPVLRDEILIAAATRTVGVEIQPRDLGVCICWYLTSGTYPGGVRKLWQGAPGDRRAAHFHKRCEISVKDVSNGSSPSRLHRCGSLVGSSDDLQPVPVWDERVSDLVEHVGCGQMPRIALRRCEISPREV